MTIGIAILTIGILVILHELGHFCAAKKFGIKVEEFGIGLPPRLFGKKYGETMYSVNALPIGGFVRMEGEEKRAEGSQSFSNKPIWQRFVVVAAGVFVFWLIAVFIFTGLGATVGIPTLVDDEAASVSNPHVRVLGVVPDSPAATAGLQLGDTIVSIEEQEIAKISQIQELSRQYAGQEIRMRILQGSETRELRLVPRENPPANEGAIGISLARAGLVQYPWYEAPFQGIARTWNITLSVFDMFGVLLAGVTSGEGLPPGAQVAGPVGVIDLLKNSLALGAASFFSFVAVISVYLAIFNTLPIPALDGGRMFFILLEGIRRKPLPEKVEQRAILISFLILIPLILWVTVGDIQRLF